jgi:hypothetical protein
LYVFHTDLHHAVSILHNPYATALPMYI